MTKFFNQAVTEDEILRRIQLFIVDKLKTCEFVVDGGLVEHTKQKYLDIERDYPVHRAIDKFGKIIPSDLKFSGILYIGAISKCEMFTDVYPSRIYDWLIFQVTAHYLSTHPEFEQVMLLVRSIPDIAEKSLILADIAAATQNSRRQLNAPSKQQH